MTTAEHLLLYDGSCGLCQRTVRFVRGRDPRGMFELATLQGESGRSILERLGLTVDAPDTFYVVANYRSDAPELFSRSRAAEFVVSRVKGMGWTRLFSGLPRTWLDAAYDAVAARRHRVFARCDECVRVGERDARR